MSAARPSPFLSLLVAVAFALSLVAVAPAVTHDVAIGADPVVAAAGDIACDPLDPNFHGGNGTTTACAEKATSNLLVGKGYAGILSLGDNQYYCGSLAAFDQVYDPTWGRVKSITHPVIGNHELLTSGNGAATGCNQSNADAAGYFGYFGSQAGPVDLGYYSFDIGAWHLIALNSNCGQAGGCSATSPQGKWLASDLRAHSEQCVLAYWHIPLFSSGGRASGQTLPLWNALYAAHADLVLDGHDHIYERFAPQTPAAVADPTNGIREITVGTGGNNHTSIATIAANSVVRNTTSFGVLALTLHAASYNWKFIAATGSFSDTGSASCHNATAPTSTPTAVKSATPTPPAGSVVALPIADAYVDASQPAANFGTSAALRIDASPVVTSYLKFTVSGLTKAVTSASLRIFANSGQSTGYTVRGVPDTTWGETTITASNAPALGSTLGSSGALSANGWSSANVTSAVSGNGTFTFALTTSNATAASLSSRTGANPPQLVVTTAP